MARVEKEFREFVAGFADPLTRLAYLLTAGTARDPALLSVDALARVRRQWRDAEMTGAPESLAVEALLCALPHRRQFHLPADTGSEEPDDPEYALAAAGKASVTAVNHDAFRRPVAGVEGPAAKPLDDPVAIDDGVDVDVLHDAVWKSWQGLSARQRVPLVFADPSVASRRLVGIAVPESFGSRRRLDLIASGARKQLRSALAADPAVGVAAEAMHDRQLADALADTLREQALSPSRVIDPYPAVVRRAQRLGRRGAMAVAAVLAVVAAGFVVAVQASQPTKTTAAAAAAKASSGSPTDAAAIAGARPSPSASSTLSSQGPFAPVARPAIPLLVVPWATRGTAAKDAVLLAHLKSYFTTVHQDASGQVQVLLATDTPTMRIAYVTSNSVNGVIQSWFYGPVGSDNLIEGASSYGGSLLPDSILADGLIDTSGHEQYVVIAPPDTTGIRIADFDFDDPNVPPGFTALPYQNGIAVKDMTAGSTASSFVIDVTVGTATYTIKDAPDIQLRPQFTGSVTSDGPPSAPLPTPAVKQGHPDSTLLADALTDAAAWEGSNPIVAARPVVLWAGTDVAGTKLVALRVKTKAYDLLVVEWSGAAPGDHAEYLVDSAAPDVPVAFAYRAVDGTRLGVIAGSGAAKVQLLGDGFDSKPMAFSSTGFASFRVPSPPSDPNDDGAGALGVVAHLQLLDASGHPLTALSVPPSLGS